VHPIYTGVKTVVAKKVVRKRRPRGSGKHPLISARLPKQVILRIERYAKDNECTRSEALLAIVLKGLGEPK
jgi:hypothetical protein